MSEQQNDIDEIALLKKHYEIIFKIFLNDNNANHTHSVAASHFGHQAINHNIGLLSLLSLHRECLASFLKTIRPEKHTEVSNKASIFLEAVLSAYQNFETSPSG